MQEMRLQLGQKESLEEDTAPPPISFSGESHGQKNLEPTVLRVAKSSTRLKRLSMHRLQNQSVKIVH